MTSSRATTTPTMLPAIGAVLAILGALIFIVTTQQGATAMHAVSVWTSTGSTCVPDDASRAAYNQHNAHFFVRSGATGSIAAQCSIVDLEAFGAGEEQVVEVAYVDPDGPGTAHRVRAFVKGVRNDGSEFAVATFDSNAHPGSATTQIRRQGFAHHFNFEAATYYVTIHVDRANTTGNPRLSIVRLTRTVN